MTQPLRLKRIGEEVRFSCNWTYNTVWFYTNIRKAKEFTIVGMGKTLTMTNLNYNHTGSYYCWGKSIYRREKLLAAFPLIVYGKCII